jgi:hypothetical protein
VVTLSSLPQPIRPAGVGLVAGVASQQWEAPGTLSLDEKITQLERAFVIEALSRTGGVQAQAARMLGITERSMWHLVKKHHIEEKIKSGTPGPDESMIGEVLWRAPSPGGTRRALQGSAAPRVPNGAGSRWAPYPRNLAKVRQARVPFSPLEGAAPDRRRGPRPRPSPPGPVRGGAPHPAGRLLVTHPARSTSSRSTNSAHRRCRSMVARRPVRAPDRRGGTGTSSGSRPSSKRLASLSRASRTTPTTRRRSCA